MDHKQIYRSHESLVGLSSKCLDSKWQQQLSIYRLSVYLYLPILHECQELL